MYDEMEARQLCIRALAQYNIASDNANQQEKDDITKAAELLKRSTLVVDIRDPAMCSALAFYLKSLKTIEHFIISDPLFRGFDGTNPLLIALDKEIRLTLETKAHTCHEDIPIRGTSRVDW